MWIKRIEYESLREAKELYEKLERRNQKLMTDQDALMNEIIRLKGIINAQIEDCKVGPWCKDCIHKGEDRAYQNTEGNGFQHQYYYGFDPELGYVYFCKKHLHELCPEFEIKPLSL